ncbi:hypothetical protein [Mycolicibacter algericus]|uniref:Uncharacterized protein n=1 Tax=Mycolicibacter algericus TaxID=1288388 RepID=A0A7I9YGS9_MYCAL|nr:hypothetical protein [Mycolicibacter algericus]GFG87880.1 hypothetical protein MALGJ_45560 [Mycolicibacter algericus]
MADAPSMSASELLIAAIRETREAAVEHGWDDYTTSFALGQMYAGTVQGNHELESIWSRETAPPQARLDLHLTEGSIEGHTAPAEKFARLVAGLSDATKEISKKKLDRKRYPSPLLVRGAGPGSLRLVIEIQPHPDDGRPDSMGELSTVDSESLRQIAAVLGSSDDLSEDSTLTAQISHLPAKARAALRKAAKQIVSEHWHIEGKVEQRGFLPAAVGISPAPNACTWS